MKIKALCVLTSLLMPLTLFSAEFDDLVEECDQCHGPGGVSVTSRVPTIAGQPSSYIGASIRSFQQWERPCIKAHTLLSDRPKDNTSMCTVSESLTGSDINALSQHYADQTFVPARQPFDKSVIESGSDLHEIHCETCHMMGGSMADRGPRLAGQWAEYLRAAIDQALSGEHLVPPVMERRVTELSDEDINALVNFYASQQ